jgi:hypothetical protein
LVNAIDSSYRSRAMAVELERLNEIIRVFHAQMKKGDQGGGVDNAEGCSRVRSAELSPTACCDAVALGLGPRIITFMVAAFRCERAASDPTRYDQRVGQALPPGARSRRSTRAGDGAGIEI